MESSEEEEEMKEEDREKVSEDGQKGKGGAIL